MIKAGEASIWLLITLICFEESNQSFQVGSASTSGHVLSDLNKMISTRNVLEEYCSLKNSVNMK